MPKELSQRQRRILDFILLHTEEKGYPPTVREIGEAVDLSSSSTVHAHLRALEGAGFITRDGSLTRAIRMSPRGPVFHPTSRVIATPLLGQVAAGQPILAQETYDEILPLPMDITAGEGSFALTVKGESMIEDGILDGDIVVVRPQQSATNGETVVVLVEDEATVKRFYKENGHIRLQPANSAMDPIIVADCYVVGKVVGLLRRYH
ncbi:MAG TPA: transcriptional repressor LexA [Armatimonadota bacterium]|jgi:repressor LexA